MKHGIFKHWLHVIQKNSGLIALWTTFLVSFLFVYNKAYLTTKVDYLREAVLALMASSITILITTLLLRQQTKSEELKDTHAEIFRKKFEVYTDFVSSLILSFEDEGNRPENVRKLEEDFYKLLLFIEDEHTFHRLYDTILDSLRNDDRGKIGFVLHALRHELGVHEAGKVLQHVEFWKEVGPKMTAFIAAAEKYRHSSDGK